MNQSKTRRVHFWDWSCIVPFLPILLKVSDNTTSTEARQEGEITQDPSGKTMSPWTFDVKFSLDTQFTFGSLTFAAGEDGDLKMLPPGLAPEHPTPAPSSTSGSTCSGLDPFARLYIRIANLVRGIPIVTSTLRISTEASSSSSSASFPSWDLSDEYPEIRASACGKSAEDSRLIFMVAPNGDQFRNSSSGYPTIGRSETSDAQILKNLPFILRILVKTEFKNSLSFSLKNLSKFAWLLKAKKILTGSF
jgi:hypothetical protein